MGRAAIFEASRPELVSPVAGSAPGNSHEEGPPRGERHRGAGHGCRPSRSALEDFAGTTCEPCPLRSRCPVKLDRRAGAYVLKADLVKVNIERRRRAEATEEWRKRYDIRAGIEGTNSELKRAHGLGRLRVRGGRRVRLAVYLKALACNLMVHARLVEMENTAHRCRMRAPLNFHRGLITLSSAATVNPPAPDHLRTPLKHHANLALARRFRHHR